MEYALAFVDENNLFFEPMHDVVHVDEKWFYEDEDKHTYYVVGDEEVPQRHRRSKRFIEKTIFLAAVAKPRYDPHRKCKFNEKIGIWSFTEDTFDLRGSANRPKGAPVTKNIESVTRAVYKDFIINKVIPAIKAVWPRGEKKKIIFIQQDNARPHLSPFESDVVAAGKKGGWNIRLLCQPPNSSDFNALNLGFFASIQSLQLRKGARGMQKLVNTVKQAYLEIDVGTLEDVFLSLHACMICALQCHGGNGYKLPHMSKNKLRREGKYPNALSVGKELYEQAAKEVNWLF
ncbi:unnamed protein product [Phytophthora fragariaefolia]|uniref:Unnamed protein product n=1 Tax=Phytophthora fragariaefolia TaxID=1490495 RepID=A0A9W6WTL2_9STRA|nr:unnamed protein product [Phytophthora fragariaefolia]